MYSGRGIENALASSFDFGGRVLGVPASLQDAQQAAWRSLALPSWTALL